MLGSDREADMATQAEIIKAGDHLNDVRTILAATGLAMLQHAGCIREHVGETEALEVVRFLGETLKPVIENIDRQLDELVDQLDKVEPEVKALEDLLQLESATDQRPGTDGYL
jgi:hypothetical protein